MIYLQIINIITPVRRNIIVERDTIRRRVLNYFVLDLTYFFSFFKLSRLAEESLSIKLKFAVVTHIELYINHFYGKFIVKQN